MSQSHMASSEDLAIGFDLGGTNLRAAVFRGLHAAAHESTPSQGVPEAAKALLSHRESVGSERNPERMVDRIAALVPMLLQKAEVGALTIPVGIGFAGMLRGHEGMVANSPNFGWRDVPLGAMLQSRLGERYSVGIYNDVNAISYGEYALGAGVGARDVLSVFVGTGIGAGAICSGQLLEGSNNTAAELGHTKVDISDDARPCSCGLKGCLEAYAGGHALQERARQELGSGMRSMAVRLAGSPLQVNPGHLDAAAEAGDEYALGLYSEVGPLLGLAIANAVTLFNPKRLVLGGGVLSRTPVLRAHVLAAFEVIVNPPALEGLQIVDTMLGEDAGLIGSALLASSHALSRDR